MRFTVPYSPNVVPYMMLYCPPPPTSLRSATSPSTQTVEGEAWVRHCPRVHKKFSILFVQSVLYYYQRAPGWADPGRKNKKYAM